MTERKSIPGGEIERDDDASFWIRRTGRNHRSYITHFLVGQALWTQAEQIEALREVAEAAGLEAGLGNLEERLLLQVQAAKDTARQVHEDVAAHRVEAAAHKEAAEKAEKGRAKTAMEKGNMEGAAVYAQNAIRKRSEALNYLQLASRLDAVV